MTTIITILPIIIFLIPLILFLIFQNKKIKNHNVLSTVLTVIGVIVLVVALFVILINKYNNDNGADISQADGFTIEQYKIVMDIKENNSINVKENIVVNFYNEGHHGIYRFIPTWLKYTSKDLKTTSKKATISDLKAIGENYEIDTVKGKPRIKIGSANYTLPLGNHTYTIEYTYDFGNDIYKNFDEFIFHAFGDYWGTGIKNASLEIHMPKKFNTDGTIHFYNDKYRKEDITQNVSYHVENNIIYADINQTLYNALTIDIELPENYFTSSNNVYGNKSLTCCIICIFVAFISLLLWIKYGKDLDKIVPAV